MNPKLESMLSQKFGKLSKSKIKKVDSKMVVKYTRVSGGKQMLNDSIENQNKAIDEFAQRFNLQVIASFGDTHESAKTDDRKEFQRMIEFCKRSRGKVSTILVYKMTRFSRTGGKAISIADELRNKYGIHIIAVSEPIDTSNPNGVLFQEMQLIFSKWDNVQRQQVTSAGMKSKLGKGEWLCKPPQGYDIVISNGERKIMLNEIGKKLKKAWEWKLKGITNEEIVVKLNKLGIKMYKQQMLKIFKNPFYCGLISHGMLDGQVVEGKQERMVSRDVFFKIHEIRQNSTKMGVPHKTENEKISLKVFVKCSDCGEPMTGYIVKKKNLYYYKCRKKGCKCNKSAKDMHMLFVNKLTEYSVKPELIPAIVYELVHGYKEQNNDSSERLSALTKRLTELNGYIETLDEKLFVKEEITKEKYDTLVAKYNSEKEKISQELAGMGNGISNLDKAIQTAITICLKPALSWKEGNFQTKSGLQKLFFPAGIVYDKKTGAFRTPEINSAIADFARLSGDLSLMKKGLSTSKSKKSLSAVRGGFEPLRTISILSVSWVFGTLKNAFLEHFNTFPYSLSVLRVNLKNDHFCGS